MRDELDEQVRRAGRLGGTLGVVAHDLGTGERAAAGADRRFAAASVIKLPILLAVLAEAEAGGRSLDDRLAAPPDARVGGSGVVKDLADAAEFSVRDLLTLMIIVSDNTATNLLIGMVGMDAVNAWCARHGLHGTVLARVMMDAAARERGEENLTTPADIAALLTGLVRGELLGERATARALDVLSRQQLNDRLPRHLPAGVTLAHKTGELAGVCHDAGIVLPGDRAPIVVVAMTEGIENEHDAAALISDTGRALYAATGLT
ncbi:serine hydrolase [Actinomadura darangshiensis]|uniref:Serine hydrolase n=1 Tax=Actinomadura darangshiensis TaxID=705336 RepID=A0A4R5B021_9ACTN|nr:serine hydrolase [Actinomadura darangshiensis]TDD79248.1 serine hydrolase [Actinomadura darangshiensis]